MRVDSAPGSRFVPPRPLRVLHISGAISATGGTGAFLINCLLGTDPRCARLDVVVETHPEPAVRALASSLGSTISLIPGKRDVFRHVHFLRRSLRRGAGYDVVHIHATGATAVSYVAIAWAAGVKTRVVHSHGTQLESSAGSLSRLLHQALRPMLTRLATHHVACSTAAGEWLFGRRFATRGVVIENGVDLESYRWDSAKRTATRMALGLTSQLVFVHVGRFAEVKNHAFLLRIWGEIAHSQPDAVLLLVGDGPLRDAMVHEATTLGIRDSVRFLGLRDDVPDLLAASDALILPSLHEGLPFVVVEAQAAGLPALVSDRVPKDVAVTDLVRFRGLTELEARWASDAIELAIGRAHTDRVEALRAAGYDRTTSAAALVRLYLT